MCSDLLHSALCVNYTASEPKCMRYSSNPSPFTDLLDLLKDMLDSLPLNFKFGCSRGEEEGSKNPRRVEWCLLGEGGTVKDLNQVCPYHMFCLLTSIHITDVAWLFELETHLGCRNPR